MCIRDRNGIRKEIEKLKKQKEIISMETSISEEELKKFDKATREIATFNSVIRDVVEEIELVKNMPLPIEKTDIIGTFSNDTSKLILDFQDKILNQAMEKWLIKQNEIITKLLFIKRGAEGKMKEALKVKSELEHKVIENEALTKLAEQIKKMCIRDRAMQLEILRQFNELCKCENIQYFAGYGTLLGAFREKGFIDWDDDIDLWRCV